jgi:hypothetical protein
MAVSENKLSHQQAPEQKLRADEHVTELSVRDSAQFTEAMSNSPKLSKSASARASKYNAYRAMQEIGGIALIVEVAVLDDYDPTGFYTGFDFQACKDTPRRMYQTLPVMSELLKAAGLLGDKI